MFSMFSSSTRALEWEALNFALLQNLPTRRFPCKQGEDDDDEDDDDANKVRTMMTITDNISRKVARKVQELV